ncbi:MAG: putative DNA binding domain-containing protein [Eubacteriales bacterium]|nr:putative DNA binding domain-containing protein [Eubacteriales bacterium]
MPKIAEEYVGVYMNSLLNLIYSGEGKNLEFKAELPKGNSIAKTVVAFSNTGGGKIIIGVNDKGDIVGLKSDRNVFELMDKVTSMIYDTCYPSILPDIYTKTINNLLVMVIEVYRGNLLPYYLKAKGKESGVYIRVGATNRLANHENVMDLERQRLNISFDQEINKTISFHSLDTTPISNRFALLDKNFSLAVMKKLKLINDENGKIVPTNGLLIILGYFDHVRIKCSRFKGNTMDVFLDSKEYSGDVFSQLENAEAFIKNHISMGSKIKGLQRDDQFEIPTEAIRESLVNAVVHRDYSNFGRDIKVAVFDDVVKITSPGSFPSTITQAEILEGRSEIKNKVVARVFKELKYIEQWGSGILRIRSSCIQRGLAVPEIIEKGDYVSVILHREHVKHKSTDKKVVDRYEEMIIHYLENTENTITTQIAQNLLGLGERRSRSILNEMVKDNLIERVGSTSNTYYRLMVSGEKDH